MTEVSRAYVSMDSIAIALGANDIVDALEARDVEVVRTGSRGLSWAEPCIEIETLLGERLLYANVTTEAINTGDSAFAGLEPLDLVDRLIGDQTRLVFSNSGLIDPLSLDQYRAQGGFQPTPFSSQDIIKEIELSGLRGRGGAGFPAHIKWSTVANTPGDQKWIVCNADEGDSGTFADRILMEGDPYRLIEGMIIAGQATGASRGVIYLRSEYPVAASVLARALDIARANSVIGPNTPFDIDLFIGAGAYICGEESSLLESLEGKRGEVRAKPPLPAIAGLYGQPTLVHNVITLASVPWIVQHGGKAYAKFGVGPSTGTMPFQISGNVARGGLFEFPFGITIRDLIDRVGGTRSGRPVKTVQIGGPLGAYLSPDEFDTPLTYEAIAQLGAGVGHGGIVLFDDTVNLAEQARYAFEFCAEESCGKCTPCRIGAVRGEELMRDTMQGSGDLDLLSELCDLMEHASLCQMGGMTPIPVRSALSKFPDDFRPIEVT
jgi:formate dehydrogenase iron-sulfur subunit